MELTVRGPTIHFVSCTRLLRGVTQPHLLYHISMHFKFQPSLFSLISHNPNQNLVFSSYQPEVIMTAPNMETITASLERCSLNNHRTSSGSISDAVGTDPSSASHSASAAAAATTTLDLNSHVSLPYHWEQCLDLKTGEIYYINWSNGMKAREDPRRIGEEDGGVSGEYYYSEDESWYDSEESSSESCPSSSREHTSPAVEKQNNVLVVAGCKSCLMYFMVPKQVEHCPKCSGKLLHFDRSDNASTSP